MPNGSIEKSFDFKIKTNYDNSDLIHTSSSGHRNVSADTNTKVSYCLYQSVSFLS